MQVLKTMLWTSVAAAALGVAGCDVFLSERPREERVYVQPQPQPVYVEQQQPQYVVVQDAPPALLVETRPVAPSGVHVWIGGSWAWENNRYNWHAGRYEVPPQAGAVWIEPSYQHEGKGYRYTPGQWKKQDNGHDHDHG